MYETHYTILDCIQKAFENQHSTDYLHNLIFLYIKERFNTSSVKKYFVASDTLDSIKKNIKKNMCISDELILQALATNLEINITFSTYENSELMKTIYPLREPEIDFEFNEKIHIIHTQTNSVSYYFFVK